MSQLQGRVPLTYRHNPYDESYMAKVKQQESSPHLAVRYSPLFFKWFTPLPDRVTLSDIGEEWCIEPCVRRDGRMKQQVSVCLDGFPPEVSTDGTFVQRDWQHRFATFLSMKFNVRVTAMFYDPRRRTMDLVLRSRAEVVRVVTRCGSLGADDTARTWSTIGNGRCCAVSAREPLTESEKRSDTLE